MANETSKAMRRRWCEDATGYYPWRTILGHGKWIDVGCGPDPIRVGNVTTFDMEDGDANHLSSYFPAESFDGVHSSQSLEHMIDPEAALRDWLKVVKPGGHLVVSVPCWELYEGMVFPSRYNPDHKSTWSIWQPGSPAPIHCYMPEFLARFSADADTRICRLVDNNYDYHVGTTRDQTWDELAGVEAFIEFVLRKKDA